MKKENPKLWFGLIVLASAAMLLAAAVVYSRHDRVEFQYPAPPESASLEVEAETVDDELIAPELTEDEELIPIGVAPNPHADLLAFIHANRKSLFKAVISGNIAFWNKFDEALSEAISKKSMNVQVRAAGRNSFGTLVDIIKYRTADGGEIVAEDRILLLDINLNKNDIRDFTLYPTALIVNNDVPIYATDSLSAYRACHSSLNSQLQAVIQQQQQQQQQVELLARQQQQQQQLEQLAQAQQQQPIVVNNYIQNETNNRDRWWDRGIIINRGWYVPPPPPRPPHPGPKPPPKPPIPDPPAPKPEPTPQPRPNPNNPPGSIYIQPHPQIINHPPTGSHPNIQVKR